MLMLKLRDLSCLVDLAINFKFYQQIQANSLLTSRDARNLGGIRVSSVVCW